MSNTEETDKDQSEAELAENAEALEQANELPEDSAENPTSEDGLKSSDAEDSPADAQEDTQTESHEEVEDEDEEEPEAGEDCPACNKGAPAWMATFADMATLLMAFFCSNSVIRAG